MNCHSQFVPVEMVNLLTPPDVQNLGKEPEVAYRNQNQKSGKAPLVDYQQGEEPPSGTKAPTSEVLPVASVSEVPNCNKIEIVHISSPPPLGKVAPPDTNPQPTNLPHIPVLNNIAKCLFNPYPPMKNRPRNPYPPMKKKPPMQQPEPMQPDRNQPIALAHVPFVQMPPTPGEAYQAIQVKKDAATKKHANAAATTEYATSPFATVSPFATATARDQPSATYPPQQGTVDAPQVTPDATQTGSSTNTPWQQQRQMPPP